jgi:hypothetical protein
MLGMNDGSGGTAIGEEAGAPCRTRHCRIYARLIKGFSWNWRRLGAGWRDVVVVVLRRGTPWSGQLLVLCDFIA